VLGRRIGFWVAVAAVGGVITPFLLEVAAERGPVGFRKFVGYSHRGVN
jgi:hypothetical protein